MQTPPLPPDEVERLRALRRLGILDTPPEARFDELTELAASILDAPTALMTLVDADRQWFKARVGFDREETPRDVAFCAHAILEEEVLVVPDATKDERFSGNPLVTGPPAIRFYAGAPMTTSDGFRLGTLCAIDGKPRVISDEQRRALEILARHAVGLIEMNQRFDELQQQVMQQKHMERDLLMVDQVTRSILESSTIDEVLLTAVSGLVNVTGWPYADLWKPDGVGYRRSYRVSLEGEPEALDQWVDRKGIVGASVERRAPIYAPKGFPHIQSVERQPCEGNHAIFTAPIQGDAPLAAVTFHLPSGFVDYGRYFEMVMAVCTNLGLASQKLIAEEARHASEEQLRDLVSNMLGGLIVIDEKGAIQQANPAATRIFGYSEEELIGLPVDLLVPHHVSKDPHYLRESFMRSIGRVTEWEGQRRDGEIFPFELALFDFETSEKRYIAGNVRDLSDRQAAERLKSEFLATVSHELRTPLTSIRGALGLLTSGKFGTLDDKGMRMLEIAERNSLRLLALINDILDFEKLESNRMDLDIRPVDLSELVEETIESIRSFANQHEVVIESSVSSSRALIDEHRITQVLTNLLSNAIKFSDRGSRVTVSDEHLGRMIEISVSDTGRGIPDAMKPRIFTRFSQVDASDAKEKGGTGLGLAISKAIVERHGGSIGFDSREGAGSRFWFRVRAEEGKDEGSVD